MSTTLVRGLVPGWVQLSGNSLWHHRDGHGIIHCKKAHGPYITVAQWSREPSGKYDVCVYCRKYVDDQERAAKKAEREAKNPPPPPPAPIEPEVLTLPPEPEKADMTKRITISEAAKLIDRTYNTVYTWTRDKSRGLHFDVGSGTMPDSDLSILEKLSEEHPRRGDDKPKSNGHTPAVAAVKPEPAVIAAKTDVSLSIQLTQDQVFLCSLMGKTQPEFVEWCVKEMCANIKARLK